MTTPTIIQEFMELTAIPVASRNERAIADVVKAKLAALGFTVEEDDAATKVNGNTGNIIARLEGEAGIPWVMFSAHLDRVKNHGAIAARIDETGTKIVSDGTSILAADDVAGICVILEGIRAIQATKMPHGGIEVVLSVCEEVGVLGAKVMDHAALRSKICYVFDASGPLGKIVVQAPTKCTITVGVHGKNAHAGNEPEKGLSAVKVAATALARLREGRLSPKSTANFGVIHGGTTTNVVCDFVEITGESRSIDDAELDAYLEEVKTLFAETAREFGTTIDVAINPLYHTFTVPESDPVVTIAQKAMRTLGLEPKCVPGGGGMDGNRFNREGIRAIGIAPGYYKNHTPNEELVIADFCQCGHLVRELVREVYTSAKG